MRLSRWALIGLPVLIVLLAQVNEGEGGAIAQAAIGLVHVKLLLAFLLLQHALLFKSQKLGVLAMLTTILGKRSVDNPNPSRVYMSLANELDADMCIPRLICEVCARGMIPGLSQLEKFILNQYGSVPRSSGRQGADELYEFAAALGHRTKNVPVCSKTFSSCSMPTKTLHTMTRDAAHTDLCST